MNDARGDRIRDAARPRILLVEDNAGVGRTFAKTLHRLGGDTTLVGTVHAAKEHLAEPCVWAGVILDLCLPDGSGFSVLEWLRAKDTDIRILILTGNPDFLSIHANFDDEKLRLLEKPIRTDQLETFLRLAEESFRERVAKRSGVPATWGEDPLHGWREKHGLSDGEVDVIARAARGQTRATIAAERGVSIQTINKQVAGLLAKLGVATFRGAIEHLQREREKARADDTGASQGRRRRT